MKYIIFDKQTTCFILYIINFPKTWDAKQFFVYKSLIKNKYKDVRNLLYP